MTHHTPGLILFSAEYAYVDENGTGHNVLQLYATGHTTTGTPMDTWDWPAGLDLRELWDIDENGNILIDPVPFQEQWRAGPAQALTLQPGEDPPDCGLMARAVLHVACESGCTAEGAEDRRALAALREARHRAAAAEIEHAALLARSDQASAELQDLLADHLRRDLGGE